jgi:hypothetical protein
MIADPPSPVSPPARETFADLLGAAGRDIDWPRVGGFFGSLAATWLLASVMLGGHFSISGLLWAALVTAAAVPAFRFLWAGVAPVVAAVAVALPWAVFDSHFGYGESLTSAAVGPFVKTLATLAGLSWSLRRIGSRPFALWFGAMWCPIALWLVQRIFDVHLAHFSERGVLSLLLEPVVFAAAMELADHMMIPRRSHSPRPLADDGAFAGDGALAGDRAFAGALPLAGDSSWRPRLLASLRDCGVQRPPRSGTGYRVLASIIVVVLAVISLIGKELSKGLRTEGDLIFGQIIGVVWLLFCIFVVYRLRNWLWRQAWKGSAASAEDELGRPDSRRPILYLRSFLLDDRINHRSFSERFLGAYPSDTAEQAITKTLRKTGPTIAIGRPDERLPPLGAARFYVSHDRWQQKVQDVAAEAQFVVLATGTTEGLRWEVSHLVATVPPQKIILWAHPHLLRLGSQEIEAEWTKFRAALGDVFPKPLPERLGEARFLYFTEDWTPHMVAPPRLPIPWFEPNQATLRRVLAVKAGVEERWSPRRWLPRLGLAGVALVLVVIPAIVLTLLLPDWVSTTRVDNTVASSQSYNDSEYFGPLLLAEAALAVLTLSLVFGRRTGWRRGRLIGIAFLAAIVLLAGSFYILHEGSRVSIRAVGAWPCEFDDFARDGKQLDPGQVRTSGREVHPGAYVKFGLAALLAALAVRLVIVGWRWTEEAAPRIPVSPADVDYAGPGDDTFADLVGATGPTVNWQRSAGFFAALAAMELMSRLSFSIYGLMWAALVAAAAVSAFRFLRPGAAPVVAAAAVAVLWAVLFGRLLPRSEFGDTFFERLFAGLWGVGLSFAALLALLGGVSWTVRRMGPRPFAFWLGAVWYPLAVWLVGRYPFDELGGDDQQKQTMLLLRTVLLGPVVFAAVMESSVRPVPARSTTRSA